jgi:hypothetical protein
MGDGTSTLSNREGAAAGVQYETSDSVQNPPPKMSVPIQHDSHVPNGRAASPLYGCCDAGGPERHQGGGINNVVLLDLDDRSELEANKRFRMFAKTFQRHFDVALSSFKPFVCGAVRSEWQKQHPTGRFLKAGWRGDWQVATDDDANAWIGIVLASSWHRTRGPRIDLECHGAIADKTKEANKYVSELMTAKYENDDAFPGMQVVRGLHNLETGQREDLVVRSITKKFWQACIDIVDDPRKNVRPRRVAAVGTSGIGKTSSTAILIRVLLEKRMTVVYLIREPNAKGWYYEIVPTDGRYEVKVYPESVDPDDILSLEHATTYFIVDPGATKDDCNVSPRYSHKVIIVASPDSRHWGHREFWNYRDGGEGVFVYYPVWPLEELLAARPVLFPELNEAEVKKRYRLFGGVPRNIRSAPVALLEKQRRAVDTLTSTELDEIATGKFSILHSYDPNLSISSLITYDLPLDKDGRRVERFDECKVILVSPAVEENVAAAKSLHLWKFFVSDPEAGYMLGPYLRSLFVDTKKKEMTFDIGDECIDCKIFCEVNVVIPCCKDVQLVSNLVVGLADAEPLVLLHSTDPSYSWIDFVFKDKANNVHAVQAATGNNRSAPREAIVKFLRDLGGGYGTVTWYYLCPSKEFDDCETDQVSAKRRKRRKKVKTKSVKVEELDCRILVASVPHPDGFEWSEELESWAYHQQWKKMAKLQTTY